MKVQNFPVEAAIGRPYHGTESGIVFEGTITDVVISGECIAFHDEQGVAFGYSSDWGSWREDDEEIVVSIPMIGTYYISTSDVNPS